MSLAVTITLSDDVRHRLDRLRSPDAQTRVNNRMGLAIQRVVQDHLRAKGPNKKFPERSTSFFGRAAAATSMQADDSGATVSINQQGIAQRFFGGAITRKDKKLTIPAVSAAYGRRAPEFGSLDVLIRRRNGKPEAIALGEKIVNQVPGKRGPKKSTEFKVLYWLVNSVIQKPDPSVLPSDDQMEKAAVTAAESQVRREWEAGKGSA